MNVSSVSVVARRLASVAVLAVSASLATSAAWAQHSVVLPAMSPLLSSATAPVLDLSDLASTAGVSYSSSSSSSSEEAVAGTAADPSSLHLSAAAASELQPPPRRRYGRPRYNDNQHNADGSAKYGFEAAIGFTQPLGNTYHYLTPSYSFQVGGIRNFNKRVGVQLQFDWDNFGFNGQTLYNQSIIEDPNNATGAIQNQLDGSSHVWSITADPTYNFINGDRFGAYGVVGAGFYHKTANFFVVVPETVYTFFGPETYGANATIDKYTSNAVGFNGGFGLTYKPGKFANERVFAEIRYVFVDNSQRTGININNFNANFNSAQQSYPTANLYPANSNKTTYLPIKFGIRF